MIIRIARFHELSAVGRDWITDALKGVPGVRGAYHASPVDGSGYVSIAINDDDDAMEVGTQPSPGADSSSVSIAGAPTRSRSTSSTTTWRTGQQQKARSGADPVNRLTGRPRP